MIAHAFYAVALPRLFCSLLLVAAAIAALGTIGSSRATAEGNTDARANKIDPWVIEHTANGEQAESMVVLVDRPTSALRRLWGQRMKRAVTCTMRCGTRARQRKSRFSNGYVTQSRNRSLYIINAILVKAAAKSPRRWQHDRTLRA